MYEYHIVSEATDQILQKGYALDIVDAYLVMNAERKKFLGGVKGRVKPTPSFERKRNAVMK